MNTAGMTQAAYAARRGVTPPAVSNWKARGWLRFTFGDDGRELVDAEATDAVLARELDPTRGRPTNGVRSGGAGEDDDDYVDTVAAARTELVREQIIRTRLQNDRAAGDLVPLAEAERRAAEAGRLVRERMHGLARGQLAEQLAAEADPRQVRAILAEAFDAAFATLADELDGQADAEAVADAALAELEAATELAEA